MKVNLRDIATVALAIALAGGCASQTATEREFGNSVRAVTAGQIHDMNAALNPQTSAVTGGNGDRLEVVINAHVNDVPQTQNVQQPVSINISSGGAR